MSAISFCYRCVLQRAVISAGLQQLFSIVNDISCATYKEQQLQSISDVTSYRSTEYQTLTAMQHNLSFSKEHIKSQQLYSILYLNTYTTYQISIAIRYIKSQQLYSILYLNSYTIYQISIAIQYIKSKQQYSTTNLNSYTAHKFSVAIQHIRYKYLYSITNISSYTA